MKPKKWFLLWGPVALYTGFIFWLSSSPRRIPGIELFPWLDKVCHTVEYAPLGVLLSRAIRQSFPSLAWRRVQIVAFLGAVAVGASDEYYQGFIPMRVSSVWDAFWDCIGASLGQLLYRRRSHRTP